MKKIIFSTIMSILVVCTVALSEYFPDIIVTSPNGVWTDTRAYASLNAAITAIGANERDIYIVRQETVTTLTIPINAKLHFMASGSIANSGQLTIQTTDISAPNKQIFTGVGNIDFASGSIIKTGWFSSIESAFALTVNDTITLIVSKAYSMTASYSPGDNVNLKWESPGNILTINAGVVCGNLKSIEAGNYQIFAGAGDFDFLDGTKLKLDWFNLLRTVLTWVEDEEVTIVISGPSTVEYTYTATENEIFDFITENGSLSINPGVVLTVHSPSNIIASETQQIKTGTGTLQFTLADGTAYAGWWAGPPIAALDDLQDHTDEIQECIDSGAIDIGILGNGYYMILGYDVAVPGQRVGIQPNDNQTITFGSNTILQCITNDGDSYAILYITEKDNITINGGRFYGDRLTHTGVIGEGGHCIFVQASTNITLNNLYAKNGWGDGYTVAFLGTGVYPHCENVYLNNCTGYNNRRNNVSVSGCLGGGIFGGLYQDANGTSPEAGIDIEPNADRGDGNPSTVRDFHVSGVNLTGNYGSGIDLIGGGTITAVSIVNNHSYSNTLNGITVYNVGKSVISGNVVYSNGEVGIYSRMGTNDCVFAGNVVYANSQTTDVNADNIRLDNTDNSIVYGNISRDGSGAKQPGYGLYIDGNCTGLRVGPNDLINGGRTGNIYNAGTVQFNSDEKKSLLVISDGSAASSLNCTLSNVVNGDSIGATDNITKGATVGNYYLSADGSELTINSSGLEYDTYIVLSGSIIRNQTNNEMSIKCESLSNGIRVVFYDSLLGGILDTTSLVDTGQMQLHLSYMSEI